MTLAAAAALALAGAQAARAQAQAQTPVAEQKVEITAQPLSDTDQRRRDPVAKTVYGREELDKYGDTNVGDVLKRLPGVNMQGGNPRMRGMAGNYTQVLVNGEPAPPGFSLEQLSPSQVERIEITRGPSAETSAQAVAGTINIILREAPRTRQRELSVRTGYQAVRPTLGANASWGDRQGALSYTVPLSLYQWRGEADTYSERISTGTDGQPQQLRVPGTDGYWGGGFNLGPRLTWKLSDSDTLSWQTFLQKTEFNNRGRFVTEVVEGIAPPSTDDRFDSGGRWQMARSSLTWNTKHANGARLEVRGGFQVSSSRSFNHTEGELNGVPSVVRDTDSHNLERSLTTGGKYTRPLGESHTLAAGWDVERRFRHEARSIVENGAPLLGEIEGRPFEVDLDRLALFVQDEWEFAPRWGTYLGVRAERITTVSSGIDEPVHSRSQVVSPIWHLTHKLNAAGRDLVRASITRSYKSPELTQLTNRPSINTQYPLPGLNSPLSPDSVGNPALQPELATGLDLAFEKYLGQGGVISIGGFHRRISGLVRNLVSLETVDYGQGPVQRWVSRPVNLSRARSTGLELELKGRGDELLPSLAAQQAWLKGLSLRVSASVYRSSVEGIPGPDDRLAQQQPWSATTGFDHSLGRLWGAPPLTVGANLAWVPGYRTQQTPEQALTVAALRTLDVYALWAIDRQTSLRLAGNNLLADGTRSLTEVVPPGGLPQSSLNTRSNRRSFGIGFSTKF